MTYGFEGSFGPVLTPEGVRFRLYAPAAKRVELVSGVAGHATDHAMRRRADGFWEVVVAGCGAGTRYAFRIDGEEPLVPDPASRRQPDGPHGPSEVTDDASFAWPDHGWHGRPWREHVFYELHVGTFTPEGTYAAAEGKLAHLAALGVTALELMPVADVPGTRNWGYDGVMLYAPSHNYGSPDDLKHFIAAAHAAGLAVFLDVVYNHFGPEGNFLHLYAPNFYTERHHTPWGAAIDVEREENVAVRAFFIENALYWLEAFRFDGLRLDAVHAIFDERPRPFLVELADAVRARVAPERSVALVLENDENQAHFLREGYRAQWNDDVHHTLHVLGTGQHDGYYADFAKTPVAMLGRALTSGYAFQGDPSAFRGGHVRGEPSRDLELLSFVNCIQNHDQIGNRPFGDRIGALAPPEALRALVAVLLLAPSPPLLFMGEEWNASAPFLFFADFEPDLAQKVTEGRRGEFASFAAFADPAARERIPDPIAPETFERSKLDWREPESPDHAAWLAYYRTLLALRARDLVPRLDNVRGTDAAYETVGARGLRATWRLNDGATLALEANLGPEPQEGFAENAPGSVMFATHDGFAGGVAPPWSVRWGVAPS